MDALAASARVCVWRPLQDREVTLDLIKRAERAGYTALAVTVDTPVLGRREADLRNQFKLPSHLTMGNFKCNPMVSQSAALGTYRFILFWFFVCLLLLLSAR